MERSDAASLRWATGVTTITGFAYAILRYFWSPVDAFAVSHPWEPFVRDAHILTSPFLVFAIGVIWRNHALTKIRLRPPPRKRRSGVGLVICAGPMILTGYLIQISVDEIWRQIMVAGHVIFGGVWGVLAWLHILDRSNAVNSVSRQWGN